MPDSYRKAALDPEWHRTRSTSPTAANAGDEPPGPDEAATQRRTPAAPLARLTFLGHSTVLIEVDRLRILTDPILVNWLGPLRRHPDPIPEGLFADLDAVFLSHAHYDHLHVPSLRRIPGRPTILVPRGLGRLAAKTGLGPVEEVEAGDGLVIDDVRVEITRAEHHGGRPLTRGSFPALGFVIDGSARIYFPGDTDFFPEMAELAGRLDVALMPVWGWGPTLGRGHLDPRRAAEATKVLRPGLAIPIHWGTLYPFGLRRLIPDRFDNPGPEYFREMAAVAPEIPVRILRPGEALELPAEPLASNTTVREA